MARSLAATSPELSRGLRRQIFQQVFEFRLKRHLPGKTTSLRSETTHNPSQIDSLYFSCDVFQQNSRLNRLGRARVPPRKSRCRLAKSSYKSALQLMCVRGSFSPASEAGTPSQPARTFGDERLRDKQEQASVPRRRSRFQTAGMMPGAV
ncbi:hypothetical protein [Rhizobium gallicum]|uniref:hypothetical protein n=1 Tax=Rhizobium gallicum TaxID=56730 RepID=UPI001EF8AA7B|nr:hypothetical protein [Rhizobium gallicum]ULJ70839.1 hypothetical protein L2W42_12920 [Rhizobium gallicum]